VAAVEQSRIEPLETLDDLFRAGLDIGLFCCIGDNGEQPGFYGAAGGYGGLEDGHGCLERILVNVDEGDIAAFDEESSGRLDAHFAAPARDHDHLALETLDGQRAGEVGRRGRSLNSRPWELVQIQRRDAGAGRAQALGRVCALHLGCVSFLKPMVCASRGVRCRPAVARLLLVPGGAGRLGFWTFQPYP